MSMKLNLSIKNKISRCAKKFPAILLSARLIMQVHNVQIGREVCFSALKSKKGQKYFFLIPINVLLPSPFSSIDFIFTAGH